MNLDTHALYEEARGLLRAAAAMSSTLSRVERDESQQEYAEAAAVAMDAFRAARQEVLDLAHKARAEIDKAERLVCLITARIPRPSVLTDAEELAAAQKAFDAISAEAGSET